MVVPSHVSQIPNAPLLEDEIPPPRSPFLRRLFTDLHASGESLICTLWKTSLFLRASLNRMFGVHKAEIHARIPNWLSEKNKVEYFIHKIELYKAQPEKQLSDLCSLDLPPGLETEETVQACRLALTQTLTFHVFSSPDSEIRINKLRQTLSSLFVGALSDSLQQTVHVKSFQIHALFKQEEDVTQLLRAVGRNRFIKTVDFHSTPTCCAMAIKESLGRPFGYGRSIAISSHGTG